MLTLTLREWAFGEIAWEKKSIQLFIVVKHSLSKLAWPELGVHATKFRDDRVRPDIAAIHRCDCLYHSLTFHFTFHLFARFAHILFRAIETKQGMGAMMWKPGLRSRFRLCVYFSLCLRLCCPLLNKPFLFIFQYRNSTSLWAWGVVAFHHVQSQPRRHGTLIMAQVVPGSIFSGKAVTLGPGVLAITTENNGLRFISERRLFYWQLPLRAARNTANGWQDTTWHTALTGCTLYLICVER